MNSFELEKLLKYAKATKATLDGVKLNVAQPASEGIWVESNPITEPPSCEEKLNLQEGSDYEILE